jgi:uncharacterized protein YbcI
MSDGSIEKAHSGQLAAAISNRVVRVLSDYTGRGPTRARTFLNDDLITVLVQDTLTKGERSLVQDGKAELVMTMRREFQDTMADELVAGVQELTGREVVAFFSASHIDPDAALESFLMAPRAEEQNSLTRAVVTAP